MSNREQSRVAPAGLILLFALCLSAAVSASATGAGPIPGDDELAAQGATVGDILIRNENIFDVSDPRENNRLFRLANRLHIRTRPAVIADQLLFRTGDRYDRRLLDESERILRSNLYLYDARIRPVAWRDGRVDVEVRTRDVWTLKPGFSFTRTGGRNTTSLDLEESNFLGRGSVIRIASRSTPDRRTNSAQFADAHLFGTRLRTDIVFADSSDGRTRAFLLERPFFSLDARWAAQAQLLDDDRIDSLFGQGAVVSRFRIQAESIRFSGGWSRGLRNGWVRRLNFGATRDESRFFALPDAAASPVVPADRTLAYPWVGFELIEDRFEEAENRDQIGRTEDFFLGTRVAATVGYASPTFGSDRDAVPFSASLGKGFVPAAARWTVRLDGTADGRVEDGTARDTFLGAAARSYLRLSEGWLFFARLSGNRAIRPDRDHQLLLGGDNGLRGYPLRHQAGDRRFLVTLEQRYYTTWFPFRLFYVGGAIFFDMGRAWGGDLPGGPNRGVLKDAGAGLRIGHARSGLGNVVHIDVAFPLDRDPSIRSVQYLIVTRQSF